MTMINAGSVERSIPSREVSTGARNSSGAVKDLLQRIHSRTFSGLEPLRRGMLLRALAAVAVGWQLLEPTPTSAAIAQTTSSHENVGLQSRNAQRLVAYQSEDAEPGSPSSDETYAADPKPDKGESQGVPVEARGRLIEQFGPKRVENPSGPQNYEVLTRIPKQAFEVDFRTRVVSTSQDAQPTLYIATDEGNALRALTVNRDTKSGEWRVVFAQGQGRDDAGLAEGRYNLGSNDEWCEGTVKVSSDGRKITFKLANGVEKEFAYDLFGQSRPRIGLQAIGPGSVVEADYVRIYEQTDPARAAAERERANFVADARAGLASRELVLVDPSSDPKSVQNETGKFIDDPSFRRPVAGSGQRSLGVGVEVPAGSGSRGTLWHSTGTYGTEDWRAIYIYENNGNWQLGYRTGTNPQPVFSAPFASGSRLDADIIVGGDNSTYVVLGSGEVRQLPNPDGFGTFDGGNGVVGLSIPPGGVTIHRLSATRP